MSENLSTADYAAKRIAALAHQAVLLEAGATPKPGLVCPDHNGAHKDMDYPLFVLSADSLRPYFEECARIGRELRGSAPKTSLPLLREAGSHAEEIMFKATSGVNTHKGMIFSMGLMAAGAGRLCGNNLPLRPHAVLKESSAIIRGIVARDLEPLRARLPERKLTAGEKLYLEYGIPGIRQEAEDGYPSVLKAFAFLTRSLESMPLDRALPHTLLFLVARVDDSNIVRRGGIEALAYARGAAKAALQLGGMATEDGIKRVLSMRDEFTRRNLSPGGSADLLAITAFLLLLRQ